VWGNLGKPKSSHQVKTQGSTSAPLGPCRGQTYYVRAATPGTRPLFKCAEVAGNTIPQLLPFKIKSGKIRNKLTIINFNKMPSLFDKNFGRKTNAAFKNHVRNAAAKQLQRIARGMLGRRKALTKKAYRNTRPRYKKHNKYNKY